MKSQNYNVVRYDADEGMVFDWKEPRFTMEQRDGKEVQVENHLYAKTIFLGVRDSIDNYIEVPEVKE